MNELTVIACKGTAQLLVCESELFGTLKLAESEVSDRWFLKRWLDLRSLNYIWAAGFIGLLACQACNLGGDDEVARNDFAAELVHAVCDTVPTCCRNAELNFDPLNCREMILRPFGGQVNAAAVHYDAEAGARCIEAAQFLSERCEEIPSNLCAEAFRGRIPPGGRCLSTYECDPGPMGIAVCSPEGICVLPARGEAGQPCSYTCKNGPGRAQCESVYGTMGPAQTACFEDQGLFCFLPPNDGPATCQSVTLDCEQRLDPEHACPPGGYCDLVTGACVAFAQLNAPCAPGGARCSNDTFCQAGICVPKRGLAIPCELPEHCTSGRCSGGFCTMYSTAAAAMCRGSSS